MFFGDNVYYALSSETGCMSLNGSVVAKNSLSYLSPTLVLTFKSIILSKNLKKCSNFKDNDPIFFIKNDKGRSVAY